MGYLSETGIELHSIAAPATGTKEIASQIRLSMVSAVDKSSLHPIPASFRPLQ